ncbi:putative reverse transcriptase domain-containing protein [Tanacetum coccineum]
MSWNDFKFMMIEEFCPSHEMQKLETELWNHAIVGAGHAAYTDRFHELARLVPHLVTPESRIIKRYVYGLAPQICRMVAATEPKTIQKAVQISGALTDEAVRNGSIKKVEKRGNVGNLARIRMVGMIIRELGLEMLLDCRGVPRNVNPVNARNPTVRACYECGSTNHVRGQGRGNQGNQVRGRAFMLGAEEGRQDPNIVTGIEPSKLGFKYEIEIASGQLVVIDKVITRCKLEIDGHVFNINLIPFTHGSFDVIIGMDWLSNHKAEIICHEKVEIEFRIELIPGAVPIAKSPYHLAPSELEELSGQPKELQEKGTDNAKISRKRSKPDNHEHGNGRAHKEPRECYQRFNLNIKIKGQNKIDGVDIRFELQGMTWHHETSLKVPHWSKPKRGMTRGLTTNTRELDFVL